MTQTTGTAVVLFFFEPVASQGKDERLGHGASRSLNRLFLARFSSISAEWTKPARAVRAGPVSDMQAHGG